VRDGRLLVLHRRKQGAIYDAVPGGTIEEGETPREAAERELREETGIRVTLGAPVLVLANQNRREFYFDAHTAEGDPVLGGPEAEKSNPGNHYVLDWLPLTGLGSSPLKPDTLKAWLVARDWTRYPE